MIKSKGETAIDGDAYPFCAGDMLFMNPIEIHSMRFYEIQPLLHKCICFDCDLIMDTQIPDELKIEKLYVNNFISAKPEGISELQRLFNNVLSVIRNITVMLRWRQSRIFQ